MNDTRIELHSRECTCRGGSWVLLEGSAGSPCSGTEEAANKVVLGLKEWKQVGKPGSVEAYNSARERQDAGERREFTRYQVNLGARIARIATWQEPDPQGQDTTAEVIATGGALVQSQMAVEKGETIEFSMSVNGQSYKTRSEVMYVSTGEGPGLDGVQRLGLKFLDAPLPESLIPSDAQPLP